MKSLAHASVYDSCRPLVIGDAGRLEDANRIVGGRLQINAIERPDQARFQPGVVDCIDLGMIPADLPYGKLSALAATPPIATSNAPCSSPPPVNSMPSAPPR